MDIHTFLHQPRSFASRSGMGHLGDALAAVPCFYGATYERVMSKSWTVGHLCRQWGNRYYGSTWNALFPILDEWRLARMLPANVDIAHFLWGEFASPRHPHWFRRKAKALVGTFHASARRLPTVLENYKAYDCFDAITLMSESQRPFFREKGVPEERLSVILHGVDTDYFAPAPKRMNRAEGPIRGLLVGSTERDHAMMAKVLRALPEGILEITILTAYDQRVLNYEHVPHATFPQHLSDQELLAAYQQSDLLIMPMLDCTANNAVLESMACGTPVMVNRVGGIPEYVDESCNIIIDDHTVDAWVDQVLHWHTHRDELAARRPHVRQWAERFDWSLVAPHYLDVYQQVLSNS